MFYITRKIFSVSYILVFILYLANPLHSQNEQLKIHFIDVGEGDSILVELPGSEIVLIDTGNPITGIKAFKYLQRLKIETIEHIFLTHPHPDHIGGVFAIAQLIDFKNIHDNGEDINTISKERELYRWYYELIRNDKRYEPVHAGRSFHFKSAIINVLWPPKNYKSSDWNVASLVMMIQFGEFRCVLMGDANKKTEEELLKTGADIQSQVLKAGHHGALDTASTEFIKAVKPEIVIISVNKRNMRGYPSDKVLKRYKQNAKIYRTDRHGTIVITASIDGTYHIK